MTGIRRHQIQYLGQSQQSWRTSLSTRLGRERRDSLGRSAWRLTNSLAAPGPLGSIGSKRGRLVMEVVMSQLPVNGVYIDNIGAYDMDEILTDAKQRYGYRQRRMEK